MSGSTSRIILYVFVFVSLFFLFLPLILPTPEEIPETPESLDCDLVAYGIDEWDLADEALTEYFGTNLGLGEEDKSFINWSVFRPFPSSAIYTPEGDLAVCFANSLNEQVAIEDVNVTRIIGRSGCEASPEIRGLALEPLQPFKLIARCPRNDSAGLLGTHVFRMSFSYSTLRGNETLTDSGYLLWQDDS